MTRLRLRYLVHEDVVGLLIQKMWIEAANPRVEWREFFTDFIVHMLGILSQITISTAEKMMVAVKNNPRAGFQFIKSHFVLEMKDNAVQRFIVVALANISRQSNIPEEIQYIASKLLIKAMTDHCGLEYTQSYLNACFYDPERAYKGKAQDVVSEVDIQRASRNGGDVF